MDLIVNFTPTGLIPKKNLTPYVPISVDEIIEDLHKAIECGITMVHLHARNQSTHEADYSREIYASIIEKARRIEEELIICVSLSGRSFPKYEHRTDPLKLEGHVKPDMASLTLSSLNFNKEASVNSPGVVQDITIELKEKNIMPELEVFDLGMINYAKYLEKKGLIEAPHYFNLILGNVACAQANILHLGVMINDLPGGSYWSLGGVGDHQLTMNSIGIAAGGGVRVGLEDNIYYDKNRERLCSNNDLLNRIKVLAEANERKIMKPAELRKLLGLESGKGKYGRNYNK